MPGGPGQLSTSVSRTEITTDVSRTLGTPAASASCFSERPAWMFACQDAQTTRVLRFRAAMICTHVRLVTLAFHVQVAERTDVVDLYVRC